MIEMKQITFLKDDIETDKKFIQKWKKERKLLRDHIKSITEHMNRRKERIKELIE